MDDATRGKLLALEQVARIILPELLPEKARLRAVKAISRAKVSTPGDLHGQDNAEALRHFTQTLQAWAIAIDPEHAKLAPQVLEGLPEA